MFACWLRSSSKVTHGFTLQFLPRCWRKLLENELREVLHVLSSIEQLTSHHQLSKVTFVSLCISLHLLCYAGVNSIQSIPIPTPNSLQFLLFNSNSISFNYIFVIFNSIYNHSIPIPIPAPIHITKGNHKIMIQHVIVSLLKH